MEWGLVTAIASVFTVIGGALGAVGRHLYKRGGYDHKSYTLAESAHMLAAGSIAKIELVARELNDHRRDDAAMFARLETLTAETGRTATAAENRLSQSLNDFGDKLTALGDRIDRVLERMLPHG